jgi:hypothetical protein
MFKHNHLFIKYVNSLHKVFAADARLAEGKLLREELTAK